MPSIPVVFVNCDTVPFLDRILALDKPLETRTRNMLRSVLNRPVLLAETRRGRRPLVRCWAMFTDPIVVRSREAWEQYRSLARIPAGSRYDWHPDTRVKYLYPVVCVVPVSPFTPQEGPRHGRTWMETILKEAISHE